MSRPAELAVLRARVPDRQSGVRRPFVLEHRRHSTAVRRRLIKLRRVYHIIILSQLYITVVQEECCNICRQTVRRYSA